MVKIRASMLAVSWTSSQEEQSVLAASHVVKVTVLVGAYCCR